MCRCLCILLCAVLPVVTLQADQILVAGQYRGASRSFVVLEMPYCPNVFIGGRAVRPCPSQDGAVAVPGGEEQPAPPVAKYEFAWYPMEDTGAAMTLTDFVGGCDATLPAGGRDAGARHVEGKLGGAISFNGDGWATIANTALCYKLTADNWSIAFWGWTGIDTHSVWLWGPSAGSAAGEFISYFNKDNNTLFSFFFTPIGMPGVYGPGVAWNGDWRHWVIVRAPDSVKVYANGVLHADVAGNALQTYMSEFRICGNADAYTQVHHIDDLRIYDFALNSDDVSYLYNDGNGTVQPLQVSHTVTRTDNPQLITVTCYDEADGQLAVLTRAVNRGYGDLPTPSGRESHQFQGWSYDGGVTLVDGNTVITQTDSHTLTSVWESTVPTLTWVYRSYGWPDAYSVFFYDGNYTFYNIDNNMTFDGQTWWTSTPELVYWLQGEGNGGDVNYAALPNLQSVSYP